MARALNENQRLILELLSVSDERRITPKLASLSQQRNIPLSTLKHNARILRELDLVTLNGSASLTTSGREVLHLLREDVAVATPLREVN